MVVVDLARDGRRFAGRRAATVVRAVADRLDGRLPDGGRLRHDDSDALSIVLPGWSRSPAADWMHRTLPEVFDDVVTAMEFTGTQLRAAVHDVDGPVGAQLLQRLDPAGERPTAAGRHDAGRHDAAGRTPFRVEEAPAGGRRRRRQGPDAGAGARSDSLPDSLPDSRADSLPDARSESRADRGAAPLEAEVSTDGLGLADLLAGALAAYRNI